jgi:protein ImuB
LSAAFAFSGALRVLERSPRAERTLLEALAVIGHRFTPGVILEPPDGLLLEVQASLALFGGIDRLRAALCEALDARAPGFRVAVAPTPLAALWLSRSGSEESNDETLVSRLGPLPLAVTRWPATVLGLLEGVGVTTIGDCLRLPRDGFARRAGKAYLEALDKSLGKHADPRAAFETSKHLDFEIELADETTSLPIFVDAVTRMTEELARELKIRQAQVGKLKLVFEHRRIEPTVHRLELLESTGHRLRLLELLCDKLERTELPAPAAALRLSAGPLEPAIAEDGRLFKGEASAESGARARLVERLRGRLGEAAVHGLAPAADHRPERAWTATEVPGVLLRRNQRRLPSGCRASGRDATSTASDERTPPDARTARDSSTPDARTTPDSSTSPDARTARVPMRGVPGEWVERPLWLLPLPEPLRCVAGRPQLDGGLRMIDGPERIESGWWDGNDVGRDYFVAVGHGGERLWVFRDRADCRWYLHGRFG